MATPAQVFCTHDWELLAEVQVTPLPRSEEMAADIANSRLIVLEECGHMSPLEKPAEVTAALRRWLSQ